MNDIYYLSAKIRNIEGKDFYCFKILDLANEQIFTFYHNVDEKSKSLATGFKRFDNISDKLKFVIKRNNKISFDIK